MDVLDLVCLDGERVCCWVSTGSSCPLCWDRGRVCLAGLLASADGVAQAVRRGRSRSILGLPRMCGRVQTTADHRRGRIAHYREQLFTIVRSLARAHPLSSSPSTTSWSLLTALAMSAIKLNAELFSKRLRNVYNAWNVSNFGTRAFPFRFTNQSTTLFPTPRIRKRRTTTPP